VRSGSSIDDAEAPRLVIFGAGMTGRGQVGQLAYEAGWRLTFVDRDAELVECLRQAGQYVVRLVSAHPREVVVSGYRILHVSQGQELASELAEADLVVTAVLPTNLPGLAPMLAEAMRRAVAAGRKQPLNIVAAENMNDSSQALWRGVQAYLTPEETERFAVQFGFPDSMIARVVPVAEDSLYILAEDYNEWTADAQACIGEPAELPGLEWVPNQKARLQRKLYIHNTGHATCAYLGALKGYEFVHEAAREPRILEWTRQAICESGAAVAAEHGFADEDIKDYEENLLARLPGDLLPDALVRVVRQPLRKLGPDERLLGPVRLCEEYGLPCEGLCRAIAAVLLLDLPGDRQCSQIKELVEQLGPRAAVEQIIGAPLLDETGHAINLHYATLKQEAS